MEAIIVALIGLVGVVIATLVEKGRRENKADHGAVSEKLDIIGKNLGRSIDRVEATVIRNEEKLDEHIRDHARGDL